jgi:hypothetical protein
LLVDEKRVSSRLGSKGSLQTLLLDSPRSRIFYIDLIGYIYNEKNFEYIAR